jgi:predicted Rossmann fold flavoprotein
MNQTKRIVVVGAGAAGYFASIHAAEKAPEAEVILLEKSNHPLAKVRISGGGRCNVTHNCPEPKKLVEFYPRGNRALLGPFHRFGPTQTIEWFANHSIKLKTEEDGRMFPITDNSGTIIDCLTRVATDFNVRLRTSCSLVGLEKSKDGRWIVNTSTSNEPLIADRIILATGGNAASKIWDIVRSFGHTVAELVPSIFTFNISDVRLNDFQGLSLPLVKLRIPEIKMEASGPFLITHWGVSGPAVLRLSAWGARELQKLGYQCELFIQWIPGKTPQEMASHLMAIKKAHGKRFVYTHPEGKIPARLWERLIEQCGISETVKWADLSNTELLALTAELSGTGRPYFVKGKSTFKEEFVTAGGIDLDEVDFRTMESKRCPGLYFAGEILDVDGITGGFNFQNAWTTGFIAGKAAASTL